MTPTAHRKFLPETDPALLAWAVNFSTLINASPTTYGITAGDAAALAADVTDFAAELAECAEPATRTKVALVNRDAARAMLKARIRPMARLIQAQRGLITEGQRISLGLPVYAASLGRSSFASPVPDAPPKVMIATTNPLRHTIRVLPGDGAARRARPVTAAGAVLFYQTFTTRPAASSPDLDLSTFRFAGLATRDKAEITYDADAAGKYATVIARWYTKRGTLGPPSPPVVAMVAG